VRISALEGRRVALWGWGREGRAAWRALRDRGIGPLALFCNQVEAAKARALDPALAIEADASAERLAAYDVVVKSPGISPYRPEAMAAS
jgi:UDP-N-acetylmuramoylalanine--D-glutamate ligase